MRCGVDRDSGGTSTRMSLCGNAIQASRQPLLQFRIRKGVPVHGRRGRHNSGYDLDPASPACPHTAADADKIHLQQPCAFQERVFLPGSDRVFRPASNSTLFTSDFYPSRRIIQYKSLPVYEHWEALHIYNLLFVISAAFSTIPLRSGCIRQ